ncbi:MAG: DNA-binding domain-containing protein [Pseudomonadota bacterium]
MTASVSTSTETARESAFAHALLAPDQPVPEAVRRAQRFAVYRNNVVVGLIDALAATYPAIQALVGETFFRAAAREFVLAHPPRSAVLIEWGGAFPDWIATFPPAAGVAYLGDVARLEWAWNRAYNAAEAVPIPIDALAALPSESLGATAIALHPSVAIVPAGFPIVSLWAQATGRVEGTRLDLGQPEIALIARPEAAVEVRAIDPGTATFLQSLAAGAPIETAAMAAGGDEALLAERLAGLFQHGLAIALRPPA